MEMKTEPSYYSLVLPGNQDPGQIEASVAGVCEVLEKSAPDRYEMILISPSTDVASIANTLTPMYQRLRIVQDPNRDVTKGWEVAEGNILGILDGDSLVKPTSLSQVVETIDGGADMAVASQYKINDDAEKPSVGCFAIRKKCLNNLGESTQAYDMLLNILGEESMQKICRYLDKIEKK